MKPGKDVFAAIDNSAALRSRTSLGEWMRANYGGLKARLDEHVPNWKVLADLFAARAHADFHLRGFGELEGLRRARILDGQVLDVCLLYTSPSPRDTR